MKRLRPEASNHFGVSIVMRPTIARKEYIIPLGDIDRSERLCAAAGVAIVNSTAAKRTPERAESRIGRDFTAMLP
jgi:hypothetical protein